MCKCVTVCKGVCVRVRDSVLLGVCEGVCVRVCGSVLLGVCKGVCVRVCVCKSVCV